MKILLAGGGTAGHINPALAIAGYISEKEKGVEILYVGAKGKMEERLVKAAGYRFKSIEIEGFSRSLSLSGIKKNIHTLRLIMSSSKRSRQIIREFSPDICIGTGGYVSGPVIRAAQKLNIPTLIHEQNAYPGVTTKMLSKNAKTVMLAVMDAKKYLNSNCNLVYTGNPIKTDILTAQRDVSRKELKLDQRPVILSFGGSLGARKINEAIIDLIKLTCENSKYQHIHAYGQHGKWFKEELNKSCAGAECKENLDIREFINDMPKCMAACDIVICRAGAITLSEIEAQGKVAILIPSPNVAENHQYHNAMALVNNRAAFMIEEKNLTGKALMDIIEKLLCNKNKYIEYQTNAKKMAVTDANERIYKIVKDTIKA